MGNNTHIEKINQCLAVPDGVSQFWDSISRQQRAGFAHLTGDRVLKNSTIKSFARLPEMQQRKFHDLLTGINNQFKKMGLS